MIDSPTAIQALWDYDDPVGSERRFTELVGGDVTPTLRVELLTQVARAQGLDRRFDDARATLNAAEALPPTDRGTIRIALERGRVARSAGDPVAARPPFEDAWNHARAAGEDGLAVDAAHMLALVSGAEEAIGWNERGLELAEHSADPDAHRWIGSLANNVGWAYHEKGKPDVALHWFDRALAARVTECDVKRERIARWTVARCLRSLGRTGESLDLQRVLAAELETAGAPDGYVFEEIGECLLALGRSDEARRYFALAHLELSRDRSIIEQEPERLARLRANAGNA